MSHNRKGDRNSIEFPYWPLPGPQDEFWRYASPKHPDVTYIGYGGPRGGGKASRNSSLVATPFGFRKIGDLKVGNRICDTEGSFQRVLQVHPQGEQDIYKVTFTTGATTYVTLDHLWLANISNSSRKRDGKKVTIMEKFTTKQLKEHIEKNKSQNENRHPLIPLPDPVNFTKSYRSDMRPIDPYLLGLLIGDGCITGTLVPSLVSEDEEILEWVKSHCDKKGWDYTSQHRDNCTVIRIKSQELIDHLSKIGLLGKGSLDKFIPDPYLYENIDNRIRLTQGLMDTDGYVDDRGHMSYTSISMDLAENFQWLIRSLGGKASIWTGEGSYRDDEGNKVICNDAHTVQFNTKINPELVSLPRKKERARYTFNGGVSELKLRMESIEFSHREEATCITVSNANSLYITDDFIVTHNSYGMRSWMVTACWNWPIQAVIIRRTRKDLQNNHINPFKQECKQLLDNGLINYNERHNEAKFKNGSILSFEFCAKNDDLQRIQGQAYDLMGLEESTQFNEHQINVMISSCRASNIATNSDTDFPNKVLMTFNWGGQSHAYHRRIFWDKEYKKDEDPDDYHFIFAPMESNTVLMEKTPEYKKQLRKLPKQLQEAWIDGNPDAFTGTMFNIVDDFHVVDGDELLRPHGGLVPDEWKLFGSLDAGTADPCSFGLYAKTPSGFVYKIDTYYVKDRNPIEHVEAIVDRIMYCPYTAEGRKPEYVLADRHAFQKRGKNQIVSHDVTWADLFRDNGIHLKRANDDRIPGAMALQYALHYDYDYQNDKLVRKPKLMFFRKNGNVDNGDTIKELVGLKRDENRTEDIDQKAPDHAYDETRYAIMGAIGPINFHEEEEEPVNPREDYGSQRDVEDLIDTFSGTKVNEWEDWY